MAEDVWGDCAGDADGIEAEIGNQKIETWKNEACEKVEKRL